MRRHSLNFCAWKDRKVAAADLRLINGAATADPAAAELDAFKEKWAGEYTSIHCPAVHVYMHERGSGMAARVAGGDPVLRLRPGDPQLRERRPQCPRMVCRPQSIRDHVQRMLQRVTVSETRMGQPKYIKFMTLPGHVPLWLLLFTSSPIRRHSRQTPLH